MATTTGIDLGGGGIVKNPVKAHGETHYRYAVSGAGNNRNTGTVKNYYGNKVGKVSDFGWAKPSTGGGYSGGSGGSSGASASASSGYSGGGSSGGGSFDMMSEYLNEMRRQREAAINAANAALDQQGKANEQIY